MRTLVVGCDASGKSTLVERISSTYGDVSIESSQSARAIKFKEDNFGRQIDLDFINEREALYLSLGEGVLSQIKRAETDLKNTVSTDATLVTRLSHEIMKSLIGERSTPPQAVVRQWLDDEALYKVHLPRIVILANPPFETILSRIRTRQLSGQKHEVFFGFNSPKFLHAYYRGWQLAWPAIAEVVPFPLLIDTNAMSIADSIELYSSQRDSHC